MKIFVSIASYRDSQLIPTVKNLIENESSKHFIVYGICLQDTDENHTILKNTFPEYNTRSENNNGHLNNNVKIFFMHYSKAKGVCYARKLLQDSVTDEDFIMQIDSHSRAIPNWDDELIKSYKMTNCYKAVLSTYPPHYALDDKEKKYLKDSTFSNVTRFNLPVRKSESQHGCAGDYLNTLGHPVRNIHIAGGFYFAPTEWIKDSPYPGDLYFEGEEDQITVLSYTNGWTVFCPEKAIIYHSYTNNLKESDEKYRPLHWEDHPTGGPERDNRFDIYKLNIGSVRSIENYFKELNQFTDNYKKFELHYSPTYPFVFKLCDKFNKVIYKKYSSVLGDNVLNLECSQQELHNSYYYMILELKDDPIKKITQIHNIFTYSFV